MKDNQHEQLFTELDNEVAASCSGGVTRLYDGVNYQGRALTFYDGHPDLRFYNFNDKTSSLTIAGNETWAFYRDINYQGSPVILNGPRSVSFVPQVGIPNDSISSLRRIA